MNRIGSHDRLALTKQRLDAAAERFASLTDGLDHPQVDTARDRLKAAGAALTGAAGGISGWTRTWLGMAVLGVAVWVSATVAGRLIGLSAGWTITVALAVVLALMWPVTMMNHALAGKANRRRVNRPASPAQVAVPVSKDPGDDVLMMLWDVRDGLAGVMRDRCDVARSAAGFDWLRRHDRYLFRISMADRCVCEAIYSIQIWLEVSEHDR